MPLFNIKLYMDGTATTKKLTTGITSRRYAETMGNVFKIMGCFTKHTAHLGHILGPKKLELLELSPKKIRILGNWDPKTQESMYSAKLPIGPMKAMAGFKGPILYNPRVGVDVPEVLMDAVFPWLKQSTLDLDEFEAAHGAKTTARQFLRQMFILAPVVIQDVAAMKILHPERCEKSPLMNDPLFKRPEFEVSCCVVLFALPFFVTRRLTKCFLLCFHRPSWSR